jgi:cyclic pyranopterin phosphate synthase
MPEFTHLDSSGAAHMVDVGDKPTTLRTARASGIVTMSAETLARIRTGDVAKGDVLAAARIAAIQAAKRTDELIPLCHSLPLESIAVEFSFPDNTSLRIEATARLHGKTGVEMEAFMAVSIAALTIYDMCKSADRAMVIAQIQLEEKSGGQSGHFLRSSNHA